MKLVRWFAVLASGSLMLLHLALPKLRVDGTTIVLLVLLLAALAGPGLRQLLPFVRRLRLGEVEIELREDLERLSKDVYEAEREAEKAHEYRPLRLDVAAEAEAVMAEAAANPEAGLLLLSAKLERTVREIAESAGVAERGRPIPVRRLLQALAERGLVDESVLSAFSDFWAIRNRVAHEARFRISASDLYSLISLGSQLLKTLAASPDVQPE